MMAKSAVSDEDPDRFLALFKGQRRIVSSLKALLPLLHYIPHAFRLLDVFLKSRYALYEQERRDG